MTNEELRTKIAITKGFRLGTAQTHDYRHGYGEIRMVNITTGEDVPNWPEDISAAWKLIEEMGENWTITVENIPDRPTEVCARIFRPYSSFHLVKSANTAARAICLVWLAWKKVLVDTVNTVDTV